MEPDFRNREYKEPFGISVHFQTRVLARSTGLANPLWLAQVGLGSLDVVLIDGLQKCRYPQLPGQGLTSRSSNDKAD